MQFNTINTTSVLLVDDLTMDFYTLIILNFWIFGFLSFFIYCRKTNNKKNKISENNNACVIEIPQEQNNKKELSDSYSEKSDKKKTQNEIEMKLISEFNKNKINIVHDDKQENSYKTSLINNYYN